MKIDFCSDLHVDAWHHTTKLYDPTRKRWLGEPFQSTFVDIDWEQYKNPDSQVLIIAGDISNDMMSSTNVVECASLVYDYVVVVDGNHDHYNNDVPVEEAMELFKQNISRFTNVYYLDGQHSLTLDGVRFLGVTGWYDWKAYETQGISDFTAKRTWSQYSNDSRYPTFVCDGPNSLAMQQAVNLADQVRLANEDDTVDKVVITTHMSPRADLMEWKANDPVWNALTPSYVNTAMDMVLRENTNGKIGHWIYGHTHARQMVQKDGILYMNNARGYPRENPPFTLTQFEVGVK